MVRIIFSINILLCVFFISCKSEQKVNGEKNLLNIQSIEIGMDTIKVIEIMGPPISKYNFKGEIFYDYVLPPNTSGQLTISFDSTGRVTDKGNIPLEE